MAGTWHLLLTVSLSFIECKVGGPWIRPWSSLAGLFSELDVWWGETCGNYWADALNEVSAGFPAGIKRSALGQEYRSHWMILWRHILPCCHSSYNHPTERVPQGAGKPHLFSTYGNHGASLHSEERASMPELFKRKKAYFHCIIITIPIVLTMFMLLQEKNYKDCQGRYKIWPTISKCDHFLKHLPEQKMFLNEHVHWLLFFQMYYHYYVVVYFCLHKQFAYQCSESC